MQAKHEIERQLENFKEKQNLDDAIETFEHIAKRLEQIDE